MLKLLKSLKVKNTLTKLTLVKNWVEDNNMELVRISENMGPISVNDSRVGWDHLCTFAGRKYVLLGLIDCTSLTTEDVIGMLAEAFGYDNIDVEYAVRRDHAINPKYRSLIVRDSLFENRCNP